MPETTDILFERLKNFDEISLLELLDITSEELLERFSDLVIKRQKQLFVEVEILNIDDEELELQDEFDGFQIETLDDGEETY
jgi:hypothetical protein